MEGTQLLSLPASGAWGWALLGLLHRMRIMQPPICVSFLSMAQQMTTSCVVQNTRAALTVPALGTRGPNSRCQQDPTPSQTLGKDPSLSLSAPGGSWQLLASRGLWPPHCSLCFRLHTAFLSCVCVSVLSLMRTLVLRFRAHPNPGSSHFEIPNSITATQLQRPFSCIRSHSQVPRVRTWTQLLRGH